MLPTSNAKDPYGLAYLIDLYQEPAYRKEAFKKHLEEGAYDQAVDMILDGFDTKSVISEITSEQGLFLLDVLGFNIKKGLHPGHLGLANLAADLFIEHVGPFCEEEKTVEPDFR